MYADAQNIVFFKS